MEIKVSKKEFKVWYNGVMHDQETFLGFHEFSITPNGDVLMYREPGYINGRDGSAILLLYSGVKDFEDQKIFECDVISDGSVDYCVIFEDGCWFAVRDENEGFELDHTLINNLHLKVVGHAFKWDGMSVRSDA